MMNINSIQPDPILIRDARTDDIQGITALIGTCGPYLTRHGAYLYFIYTRCFSSTCAVAIQDGAIVGWCSMLSVANGKYFLHQLGIAPETRGRGVALALFAYLLEKLRRRHADDFRLEFTTDRRNVAVRHLNRKVADCFGMHLEKLSETVPPLDDGCDEELYEMTPLQKLESVTIGPAKGPSKLKIRS